MTPHPFFITGLPRSRSAWLSNLFTTDQTVCHHDKPYEEHLLVNPRRVGFSGPEIAAQFTEIRKQHPECPWVVVLRNAGEALTSLKHWAGDLLPQDDVVDVFWKERVHLIAHICTHANVQTVSFEGLNDEINTRLIWAHLLPGIAFDLERWKLLCGLNVQQQLKGKPWPSAQSRA